MLTIKYNKQDGRQIKANHQRIIIPYKDLKENLSEKKNIIQTHFLSDNYTITRYTTNSIVNKIN